MTNQMTTPPEFHKDVQLDAILVHAAIHGILQIVCPSQGMTTKQALDRWRWMQQQDPKYKLAVQTKVENFEANRTADPG